jgi:hypothetical protein
MGEAHNNTTPAKKGSYNLAKSGLVAYFPIEEPGFMRPSMALILFERPDGEVYCSLDFRWGSLNGMDE